MLSDLFSLSAHQMAFSFKLRHLLTRLTSVLHVKSSTVISNIMLYTTSGLPFKIKLADTPFTYEHMTFAFSPGTIFSWLDGGKHHALILMTSFSRVTYLSYLTYAPRPPTLTYLALTFPLHYRGNYSFKLRSIRTLTRLTITQFSFNWNLKYYLMCMLQDLPHKKPGVVCL